MVSVWFSRNDDYSQVSGRNKTCGSLSLFQADKRTKILNPNEIAGRIS